MSLPDSSRQIKEMGRYPQMCYHPNRRACLATGKAGRCKAKCQWRGPLHGIPYGLKDLFAVKGYKTTWGSVPFKDQVIDEDAFVYTQLRKAGAVLVAKLRWASWPITIFGLAAEPATRGT